MKKFQHVILAAPEISILASKQDNFFSSIKRQESNYPSSTKTIIVIRKGFLDEGKYSLEETSSFLTIERKTKGALATLGLCLDAIDAKLPIIVSPFDGFIGISEKDFLSAMESSSCEAGLVAFESTNPKYSYVKMIQNEAVEIAEKSVISSLATSGTFYFKDKEILIECIQWAILNRVTFKDDYFIAPSLNSVIMNGSKLGIYEIDENLYTRVEMKEFQEE
jgi:hypothetical protein